MEQVDFVYVERFRIKCNPLFYKKQENFGTPFLKLQNYEKQIWYMDRLIDCETRRRVRSWRNDMQFLTLIKA